MRSIKILLFFVFVINSTNAFCQLPMEESINFLESIKVDISSFKDSSALYACNIQIVVSKNKEIKPKITTNDTAMFQKLIGIGNSLQSYNFTPLMGKHDSVKFIFPIVIMVVSSKYGIQMLDAQILSNEINDLFYLKTNADKTVPIVYLPTLIKIADKKNYN